MLGASGRQLLFLMTVLAKTLFALVGSHLVAFTFFSAGHDAIGLCLTIDMFILALEVVLNLLHEHLCGLECGDAMLGDDDGGVL